MSKRCLSNKYKPGKEPEEVAESETAEAEGVSKEEHMRLEKCKIIHYVDSNFAQKGLDPPEKGPPKVALYQEIWEAHPDMLLANGRSRKATGVRDLFNTIFRHSCVRNTTWKAFFEDPKGCLKDDKLRYDEYCASIKPSPHTETSSVAESEPLTTPAKSADIQTSSTAGDPESTAHLANRGVTVSALSEDLLNHEFTRPHTEQQVVPNISTHERSDLAGGVPSGTQSFNHESSLSIPTRSSAQANGEPQQPDFDKSQAPIDPSLSTSKASKAAQSEVVACVQHKLELSGSRLFGPEAAPSQRRFACSKLGCGYETVWFSLSDIEHMRAAWPSDDVSQRPSPIMPPKRPNIVPRPDATRYHLDTGSLSRSLQDMFARIKSQIHQAFEDRGIEHGQAARLVINARTGVQQLYEVIIGDVDPSGNKDRIVTTVSAEDLGMSMFGAFLFSNVLSGSSEETFDQFQAKFDFAAEETDKVLQELSTSSFPITEKLLLTCSQEVIAIRFFEMCTFAACTTNLGFRRPSSTWPTVLQKTSP